MLSTLYLFSVFSSSPFITLGLCFVFIKAYMAGIAFCENDKIAWKGGLDRLFKGHIQPKPIETCAMFSMTGEGRTASE
jgi:hypothetical protein